MKHIFLLGLVLMSAVHVVGQKQQADSLVNVLNNKRLSNEEQVELYSKIVDRYILFDLNKAAEYAEKGLKLSEKEGNKTMSSKFNVSFGRIYNTKSSYDTAFVYLNKALELAKTAKDKEQEASVLVGIGVMYARQGQHLPALEHFIKALSIHENAGSKQKCLPTLGNIASLYRAMDNNERAIYYLEKAKIIAEELNNADGKMQTYFELSAIYYVQREIDQALEYAQKAYEISCSLDNRMYRGAITEVLSGIYYDHLKDYDIAWKYANECLQLAQEMGDPMMNVGAWKTISNLHRVGNKYKESVVAAQKALAIDSTDVNATINLYENIVLSNILLGNNADAATFFYRYIATRNKHVSQNNRELLADMETKYETEKKEMRIASLEKERQLYIWLTVAGVLFVLALIITLWQTLKNARKEKQLIATRSVLDGEMKERTRLAQDLHDRLSGSLSAMKIELNSHAETLQNVRDKLDNCIKDIRNTAHNLMPVSLQFGIKVALEDFAAQFPTLRFHFFGAEKHMEERMEFAIYCCACELVNNAIKHSGATDIHLQLVQAEKHVTLTVSDDGCGFDAKEVKKGFGLKSIYDRVASCNGKIDVSSSPGEGTETTIELKTDHA